MHKRRFDIENVRIPVQHGALEGEVFIPRGPHRGWLIFTHPHPLYGGSFRQPLVVQVCQMGVEEGWASLRFNFRGVGASTGSFSGGVGEVQDLHQAICWLKDTRGVQNPLVGGYSFGAWITYNWAERHSELTCGWVGLAPPTGILPFEEPRNRLFRWFITGGSDPFVQVDRIQRWVESNPDICQFFVIPDADHFFYGKASQLIPIFRNIFSSLAFGIGSEERGRIGMNPGLLNDSS